MDQNLLDKHFTTRVWDLLTQGYTISTENMSGHQGELAKVCLTKGGKFYVLFARSISFANRHSCEVSPKDEPWGEAVDVVFAKAEEGYRKGDTLWLSLCQRLSSTRLYAVGHHCGSRTYTADRDEAMAAWLKHKAREALRYAPSALDKKALTSDAAITAAFRVLKRRDGFKTLHKYEVKGVSIRDVGSKNRIEVVVRKATARCPVYHEIFRAHDARKGA